MALTFVNQVGAVEGMNQAAPGTLIPESFVRWSQDVLFDRAGLLRRRGPFEEFQTYLETTPNTRTEYDPTSASADHERVLGVFSTYTPSGVVRIGMLVHITTSSGTQSSVIRVFDDYFTYLGEEVLPFIIPRLSIVNAKPALGGGLWVSVASDPADSGTHYQFFWRGGYNKVASLSCVFDQHTYTANDGPFHSAPHVHGTYNKEISVSSPATAAGLHEGQFVYTTDGKYIGTIASVNTSSTPNTFTLEKYPFVWDLTVTHNHVGPSGGELGTATLTQNLYICSVRPYEHFHGRGLLSTTADNAPDIVSGDPGTSAEGHWLSAQVANYYVYRSSDNAFLGKVNTVTANNDADFVQECGIKIEGEEYVMKPIVSTDLTNGFKVSSRNPYSFAGLYTAVYAGYQWYGNLANDDQNTNRVVFSAAHDREAVDLSRDAADSIIFPGKSKFRGLGASASGLLVFLEDRTYILRGNDRVNFSVEQLVPEGCLCPTSIVEYGGGVFWAGKSGIMYFDGASVRNLTKDNLGLYYTDSLDEFNPEQDRVIGFIHKNNLIMHYTSWKSPFDPVRYEPLYADDWLNAPDKYGRDNWTQFDSDFEYDDFFTDNNTPIYWDKKILNNPEESAATGQAITYGYGTYAKSIAGTTIPTVFDTNYIYMPDISTASQRFKKWNGTSYVTQSLAGPVTNVSPGTTVYAYTGTSYITATVYVWDGSAWNAGSASSTLWGNTTSINKYGPLRTNTSITFCVYLPTNSITTLSNMDFRGITSAETIYGLKTIIGVNSVETNSKHIITNIERASNVSTLTISGGNTFAVNDTVTVFLENYPTFNGTFTVTAVSGNTLSYANTGSNVASTVITGAENIVTEVFTNKYRARFIDIHPVFDTNTNGEDELLVEKINIPNTDIVKGPDFYLQTKHFTVGDPILRKWFQKILLSMLLYDGAVRMDLVDDDDNDEVDISKKKHKYWEIFTEKGYDWDYLGAGEGTNFGVVFPKLTSPLISNWTNVEGTQTLWSELFTADFNRYSKRVSWRKPSLGFRLYQLNNYRKPFNGVVTRPNRVELQGFSVGFKPMRQGRV